MNSTKCPYFCLVCLLVVLFLFSSNAISADKSEEKYKPDQALVQASFKKAKELGHNPIPMYVEKEGGNIFIAAGVMMSIRNGRQTCVENDMVINVGEFPFPVSDIKLFKGEYAVVKNGKFVKQAGKITAEAVVKNGKFVKQAGKITAEMDGEKWVNSMINAVEKGNCNKVEQLVAEQMKNSSAMKSYKGTGLVEMVHYVAILHVTTDLAGKCDDLFLKLCDRALNLNVKSKLKFFVYDFRADFWFKKRVYNNAFKDYEKSLSLSPDGMNGLLGLSWLLATCYDEKYRNGQRSLELAEKAIKLESEKRNVTPRSLNVLAAAYAELNNFKEAIKKQKEAISLLHKGDSKIDEYEKRLSSYKVGNPWREKR